MTGYIGLVEYYRKPLVSHEFGTRIYAPSEGEDRYRIVTTDGDGRRQPGNFFIQGHDKRAGRYLVALDGGTTLAQKLDKLGYVPGSGKSLRDDTLAADSSYETCGRLDLDRNTCRVIGPGAEMRRHRAADDRHSG